MLLLFLLIPLNAMSADMCSQLIEHFKSFETQIANKQIESCSSFKLSDSPEDKTLMELISNDKVYKDRDEDEDKSRNLFNQVKCKDVSFLENRMRNVENQINSILGFKKLVQTVASSPDQILIDKVADKKEMEDYKTDVRMAALLENYITNPVFFKFLTKEDLENPSTYRAGVEKHCLDNSIAKVPSLADLCGRLTAEEITTSSLESLKDLFKTYTGAKDDNEKNKLLESWKTELSIVIQDNDKDDSNDKPTTFDKLDENLDKMSIATIKERLKTITTLTRIKHVKGTDGNGIDQMFKKLSENNINADESLKRKRLLTAHNDIYDRQLAERDSRLSLLWLEFKPTGSNETDYLKRVQILKKVKEDLDTNSGGVKDLKSTHLGDALRALQATHEQVDKLGNVVKCLDEPQEIGKKNIATLCEKIFSSAEVYDKEIIALSNELKLLTTIHNKIFDEDTNPKNHKLIKMKQIAMDAMKRNNCTTSEKYDLKNCNISGVLSPELEKILIAGTEISLMYSEPSEDDLADAMEICDAADKSEYISLCALAAKTDTPPKKPDHTKEKVNGPMSPESRNNPMRDALLNGARNLAAQIGQIFQQPKMPYYMNNNANRYGPPSPTISQYLIGTSVARGELRPYTSVSQNFFAYKPLR